MSKILKQKRGSVLVFSLILLAALLSATLAVATVSVSNLKLTVVTNQSNQSFQVANSGVELVLQQTYKTPPHATLNVLAGALGLAAACSGGFITQNNVVGGSIKVSFYDSSDTLIGCADTDWRTKASRVVSEGTAFGTTRLLEMSVKPL